MSIRKALRMLSRGIGSPAPGDIIRYKVKDKFGIQEHIAQVTWVEDKGDRWFTGMKPSYDKSYYDPGLGLFGAINIYKDHPKRFGVQDWEIIDHVDEPRSDYFPRLYKNPKYDLMH